MQLGQLPDALDVLAAGVGRFEHALQLPALLFELGLASLARGVQSFQQQGPRIGAGSEVGRVDRVPEARIAGDEADAGRGDAGADQIEPGFEKEAQQAERGDRRTRRAGSGRRTAAR